MFESEKQQNSLFTTRLFTRYNDRKLIFDAETERVCRGEGVVSGNSSYLHHHRSTCKHPFIPLANPLELQDLRKARRDQHNGKPMSSYAVASRRSVFLGSVNLVLTICLLGFLLYFFQLNGIFSQRGVASTTPPTPQGIYNQATSGMPILDDSLSENSANNWNVSIEKTNLSCGFTNGAYFASTQKVNPEALCVAQSTNFSNFAYQIQMMFTKTATIDGGIVFRADAVNCKLYYFLIDPHGNYWLSLSVQCGGVPDRVLLQGSSASIHTGLNQPNLMAVVALGNTLYLYVNKQYIGKVSDRNLSSGQIGVLATNPTAGPGEVLFRHAQVWQLK
jgi:hypothetical protein